jgi:hypothetical protein
MPRHYILMGDVVKSRNYDARELRRRFIDVVASCNKGLAQEVLSPYTVTLGDEFQGVARSLLSAIDAIFYMEETVLIKTFEFKIRYVIVHGEIDTTINKLKAHTMMGPGLTRARKILTDKGRGTPRFRFDLPDTYRMEQLNRLFLVADGVMDRWDPADGRLILDMIDNSHNAEVADRHGKNRSQIWKRRKTLLIEEYRALKETIRELAKQD